ncbi:MAG: lactoylglutathione lyase [Chlamydiales bacterium]|jgi:lactoylglutathione lyase
MMKYLHTMVRVQDLDKSLDFYCNVMGMEELRRRDSKLGRFTLVFLAAPNDLDKAKEEMAPLLELTYNWDPEEYKGGRNFGHLAFSVDDIYSFSQKVMDHDVEINRPPRDGKMAFIKSPDGISIEILQKGEALSEKEPWVSMENIGTW